MMDNKKDSIRSVDRAIDILQTFSFEAAHLGLNQICEKASLPKTTVFRILLTLEQRGLVLLDKETGKYHLGYEMIKYGAIAQASNSLGTVAKEEMISLSRETQQTCNIYIREGFERLCIAQIEGPQYVRRYSYLGARYPLYCGAGKLLLAYTDKSFRDDYFKQVKFEKFTENTIMTKKELNQDIQKILKNGYSVTLGERDPGTAMIAMPLFDYSNNCIAAITISGPVSSFTNKVIKEYISHLDVSAKKISSLLGFGKNSD